jgi:hypothetical protein
LDVAFSASPSVDVRFAAAVESGRKKSLGD